MITVECTNSSCTDCGVRRRVPLYLVTEGVIARPDLLCAGCHHTLSTVLDTEEGATNDG
jgi:hypothetical protein